LGVAQPPPAGAHPAFHSRPLAEEAELKTRATAAPAEPGK
jgi:hypothetical protein